MRTSTAARLSSSVSCAQVATGACYLVNSFGHLIFPRLHLPFYLLLTDLLSETALMLWLVSFGVNGSQRLETPTRGL